MLSFFVNLFVWLASKWWIWLAALLAWAMFHIA